MKTFIATLLVTSISFAAEPAFKQTCEVKGDRIYCEPPIIAADAYVVPGSGGDAPIADQESPVMAPDIPGVSVRLKAGEAAPFDARAIALDENLRRGKAIADCKGELEYGKTNVWTSKPVLVALIVGGIVLGAAAGAGAAAWALKK